MSESDNPNPPATTAQKITVQKDGPYLVQGHVPLVSKAQVVTELGEPLTWLKTDARETPQTYKLCRCGNSGHKPFCDNTHTRVPFDGTETAETNTTVERRVAMQGGGIIVRRDHSLCIGAGYCGNRRTNIAKLVAESAANPEDVRARVQAIAMIENCPSGSYTYSLTRGGDDVEPDLPKQVAVTTEITSDGPIAGPLWVTGGIPIERSDGQPMETRNRVTLCCCGQSKTKPLCDGSHKD